VLLWLIHSRSEYRRLVGDSGGAPQPARLRHSLFVALWEEELGQSASPFEHRYRARTVAELDHIA
jgi:hypothetical protein